MIKKLSFIVVIALALFGAYTLSFFIHEYSHVEDYDFLGENNGIVCIFGGPPSIGLDLLKHGGYAYSLSTDQKESEAILDKIKSVRIETENKAYTRQVLFLLVFLFFLYIFYKNYKFR